MGPSRIDGTIYGAANPSYGVLGEPTRPAEWEGNLTTWSKEGGVPFANWWRHGDVLKF